MPAPNRQRILRQHLQTDQLLGVSAVPVHLQAIAPTSATPKSMPPSKIARPEPAPPAATIKPPVTPIPAKPVRASTTAPQPLVQSPSIVVVVKPRTREEKAHELALLNDEEVKGCKKCTLCEARTQTVFGEGDPDSPLLFIGEGPGETEDLQGRPFVGRAGELLDKMILAMGTKRENVFIANVVKCRPPGNRTPTPIEIDACWSYLLRQIAIIHPKAIVALGAPASKTLLQTSTGITALRGQWHWFQGLVPQGPAIPVMPTFHPAYLLRNYTPDARRKVWEDLQKVMALLRGEIQLPPN